LAKLIARFCAALEWGREKCVPVTTIALALAMRASSMSVSSSALSAQLSR
jgi:hypothetical protein